MMNGLIRFTNTPRGIARLLGSACLVFGGTMGEAKESEKTLPYVVSATVPFYPPLPRVQRVSGVVRLRITTDGRKVSDIKAEEGHPLLVKAAIANVKMWEFQEHTPTVFETTFRYVIQEVPPGEASDPKYRQVKLMLPALVEITTTPPGESDPVVQKDQ